MERTLQAHVARVLFLGVMLFAVGLAGLGVNTAFAGGIGLSNAQARAIALHAVPGRVVGVQHEHRVVEVRVRDTHGDLREVTINPRSGHVTRIDRKD